MARIIYWLLLILVIGICVAGTGILALLSVTAPLSLNKVLMNLLHPPTSVN
ncbi:MAG: DUF6040 family protein, partial [Lachnospiraceae bacterium]